MTVTPALHEDQSKSPKFVEKKPDEMVTERTSPPVSSIVSISALAEQGEDLCVARRYAGERGSWVCPEEALLILADMQLVLSLPSRSASANVQAVLMQAPLAPSHHAPPGPGSAPLPMWANRRVGFDHVTAIHDILVQVCIFFPWRRAMRSRAQHLRMAQSQII